MVPFLLGDLCPALLHSLGYDEREGDFLPALQRSLGLFGLDCLLAALRARRLPFEGHYPSDHAPLSRG